MGNLSRRSYNWMRRSRQYSIKPKLLGIERRDLAAMVCTTTAPALGTLALMTDAVLLCEYVPNIQHQEVKCMQS